MTYKNKQLRVIIAAAGIACSTGVFAATVPNLASQYSSTDYNIGDVAGYLSNTLYAWAGDVYTQVNLNTGAISTNASDITTNTNSIASINNDIDNLPTTADVNTDINTAISNLSGNTGFATAVDSVISSDTNLPTLTQQTTNMKNIGDLQTQQTTDESDITKNASGISTNAKAISANASSITNINTAITNLPTTISSTIGSYATTPNENFTSAVDAAITADTNLPTSKQQNANKNAISTINTTLSSTGSIGSAIAALPTTVSNDVNSTIGSYTTTPNENFTSAVNSVIGTALGSQGSITSSINTAISNLSGNTGFNSAVNTAVAASINSATSNAVQTAVSAVANTAANTAVNTTITNALAPATSSSAAGSIAAAITTETQPLAQHLGSGFWFANSVASLQTALSDAGAEALKNGNPQTVKLSGGDYSLSSPIPANVTLEGAGEGVTNITGTITMDSNSALANLTVTDTAGSGDLFNLDVTAANGTFTFSRVDMEAASMTGFGFSNTNNSPFSVTITSSFINLANIDSGISKVALNLTNDMLEKGCSELENLPMNTDIAIQGGPDQYVGTWHYCSNTN
ncbi:MAG TPA: hypothetical protein VJK30_05360 [Coxiellaceae bacterium]|nr:MAG: hypothetical protein A3E81_00995 [Gammaproteobacteria bacterium RIFCSPHIGHO2_12_FULL_36_30]HLB56738.1 hypothetical protein [Coxiellaceae bacterium]